MNEIISKISKKDLSRILYLLSGLLLIVTLINGFSDIDINYIGYQFFYIDTPQISATFLTVSFDIIILFVLPLENALIKSLYKHIENDEIQRHKALYIIYTVGDILDLAASVYAFLFAFVLYDYSYSIFWDIFTIVTSMIIAVRSFHTLWNHFYYRNQEIVNKNSL